MRSVQTQLASLYPLTPSSVISHTHLHIVNSKTAAEFKFWLSHLLAVGPVGLSKPQFPNLQNEAMNTLWSFKSKKAVDHLNGQLEESTEMHCLKIICCMHLCAFNMFNVQNTFSKKRRNESVRENGCSGYRTWRKLTKAPRFWLCRDWRKHFFPLYS